jgi:hypothetical protein
LRAPRGFLISYSLPPVAVALARRDMVYAQHPVSWAVDRLCELDGARWVYDSDELGTIRRDVMKILTHHAASRQAAMAPYGKMLLAHHAGWARNNRSSWQSSDR